MKLRKPVRVIALLMCLCVLLSVFPSLPRVQAAKLPDKTLQSDIAGIINWKKRDVGSSPDGYLINNTFLELAGTTPGDWFPIGLGRYGYPDNDRAYLAVIADKVSKRYRQSEKLSASKATEWHRISLAILAMGGDPTKIGRDADGKPINLIADGTYNRGKTVPLGKQGINGWIWGLIALDALRYPIPSGSYYSRDDIISEILRCQLPDGGFALTGQVSDPDITAMALQALAPYQSSTKAYSYQDKNKTQKTKSVKEVTGEALSALSKMQGSDGGYASWGTQNVESACQVVVALCCLGINPETDPRFMKNGKTAVDGIMKYRMSDGGFMHSLIADSDNPSSVPNKSNSMASEQTLYTLVALYRYRNGMRTLYDFRPESKKIAAATVSSVPAKKDTASSRPKEKNNPSSSSVSSEKQENSTVLFTQADRKAVDALPENPTTEQYTQVVQLLDKLEKSADFDQKSNCLKKLQAAKGKIEMVQNAVDRLNQDIAEKLYPIESLTLTDRQTVYDIASRYNALSGYDQKKISHSGDILRAKTQVDNLQRAVVISVVLVPVAAGAAAYLLMRAKKRKKTKQAARPDFGADEDGKEYP